jgi:hypothetical protein
MEQILKSIKHIIDDMVIKKKPDWEEFSSDQNDVMHITHSRAEIVSLFVSHILGVDFTAIPINELFDSDFYRDALQKSGASDSFDHKVLGNVSVYVKDLSNKFSSLDLFDN